MPCKPALFTVRCSPVQSHVPDPNRGNSSNTSRPNPILRLDSLRPSRPTSFVLFPPRPTMPSAVNDILSGTAGGIAQVLKAVRVTRQRAWELTSACLFRRFLWASLLTLVSVSELKWILSAHLNAFSVKVVRDERCLTGLMLTAPCSECKQPRKGLIVVC